MAEWRHAYVTSVSFGTVAATSYTINSDTSITATAPAQDQGTLVDITVTTAHGTSATSSSDEYRYVNGGPTGANNTVYAGENSSYGFQTSDFGFIDGTNLPTNSFYAVKITSLPGAGTLTDNGVAVTAGQYVSVADIDAGYLVFTPDANEYGTAYASFTFQVQDDGGTAYGGIDTDPIARTMTINVTEGIL